jgi:hypothetical protein
MECLEKVWDKKARLIFAEKGVEVANQVTSPYDGIINPNFHIGLMKNIHITKAREEAWAAYLKEISVKRRFVGRHQEQRCFDAAGDHLGIDRWRKLSPRVHWLIRFWHGLFGELVLIDPIDWEYYIAVKKDLALRILTIGLP